MCHMPTFLDQTLSFHRSTNTPHTHLALSRSLSLSVSLSLFTRQTCVSRYTAYPPRPRYLPDGIVPSSPSLSLLSADDRGQACAAELCLSTPLPLLMITLPGCLFVSLHALAIAVSNRSSGIVRMDADISGIGTRMRMDAWMRSAFSSVVELIE